VQEEGIHKDWAAPSDPDPKITNMKDGCTHSAHKAEHAVDLDTGAIVGVTIQGADVGDTLAQPDIATHGEYDDAPSEAHVQYAEHCPSLASGSPSTRFPSA
jgi:hypothetical protein